MSMSRWDSDPQGEIWIPTEQLARSPGHPFYMKLNQVLREEEFDQKIEEICAPFYKEGGRPSIPLGVYFRMLLTGYFEGIDSQRGIAWRCADSLSLREFLGLALSERTPDHSSLTRIRKRLSLDVHEQMFSLVLAMAHKRGLLRGKTVLVDATTLEANAAMRSIVRKDTGEDWNEYLTRIAKADGIEEPTAEDLQRYDTKRKGKKVSNKDWRSKTDPDARIAKMKDGRTHMAYKAEHVVDADSGLIIAAAIEPAGSSDAETIKSRLIDAQASLLRAGSEQVLEEAVGDKGYHKLDTLAWTAELGIRTYLPEKQQRGKRDWNHYTAAQKISYHNNRRRTKGPRGRRLLRLRGERVERSFAHVCETGGARRTWIRGTEETSKYYTLRALAFNRGVLLRSICGIGKPRVLQDKRKGRKGLHAAIFFIFRALAAGVRTLRAHSARTLSAVPGRESILPAIKQAKRDLYSTGC